MTPAQRKQFEEELARIVRRRERLSAALAGSADVERVQVRQCVVPEHTRGAHTRIVIRLKKPRKKKR